MYVPSYRPGYIESAAFSSIPEIIMCLEDGTPDHEKSAARYLAANAVSMLKELGKTVIVRVNDLHSEYIEADLEVIVPAAPDRIRLPKVTGIDDIATIIADVQLRTRIGNSIPKLEVMIENLAVVSELDAILGLFPEHVQAVTIGGEDLLKDFDQTSVSNRSFQLYSDLLAHVVEISNRHDKPVYDTVFMNLHSPSDFRAACEKSRKRGFKGRSIIHPSQFPIVQEVY